MDTALCAGWLSKTMCGSQIANRVHPAACPGFTATPFFRSRRHSSVFKRGIRVVLEISYRTAPGVTVAVVVPRSRIRFSGSIQDCVIHTICSEILACL